MEQACAENVGGAIVEMGAGLSDEAHHGAAVLVVKSFLDILRIPLSVRFEHGVEDSQQLAEAGGDDDFERLAVRFQAFGKLADGGVAAFGGAFRDAPCTRRAAFHVKRGPASTTSARP